MDKPITRKEFDDLRNLVYSLIKRIDNDKYYDLADKNGIRQTEGQHGEAISEHSESINQNTADIDYIAMETGVDL